MDSWGKPSLRESFNDYKKKFNLEGVMTVTNTRMNPKVKTNPHGGAHRVPQNTKGNQWMNIRTCM